MTMALRKEILSKARRIVIKLGTGLLTDSQNHLALEQIECLVAQIAVLHQEKRQVAVVSSGAIAAGMAELALSQRPRKLDELQAAAAIGQSKLMALYDGLFSKFNIVIAQVLLTHDDLKNRARHLNAHNTLMTLVARNVIPIVNENDTVSVDEIKFGDNDLLGALTATLIDADLLVILSHVEGLLRQGIPLSVVGDISAEIEQLAGGTNRATSVGGMRSKIEAARIVTRAGIPMVIASGERRRVLEDLLTGADIGTLFVPKEGKLASRKRWIAFFQRPVGAIVVDDGAARAVRDNGKSLLAKGIVSADGKFGKGDVVSITDKNRVEFARGLAKVSSTEWKSISGVVVHRDDLVIL
ncbi:MAG TPA: glutamate 5-kinase [Verrucomicrobiae bacterium]|nr:glutamate 5-kinase [Verrucomicrobiae bacterium]